eukprot:gene18784-20675_t
MAEDEMLFDPSLKKKKKKKIPIDFDDFEEEKNQVEPEKTQDNEAQDQENDEQDKKKEADIDLDLDDFSKMKKKKKKKKFDLSALDDALPTETTKDVSDEKTNNVAVQDAGVEEELDFSLKKKKKKKPKDILLDDDEDGESKKDTEDGVEAGSSAQEERDYTYEELLKRVFDIMRLKNPAMTEGGKKKFVMKPPQVVRIGTKKTSFVNFADICRILHRQPKHLLAFLLAELGTSGSVDGGNQLIIKGRFQQKQIENVLRSVRRVVQDVLLQPSLKGSRVPPGHVLAHVKYQGTEIVKQLQSLGVTAIVQNGLGIVDFYPSSTLAVKWIQENDLQNMDSLKQKLKKISLAKCNGIIVVEVTENSKQYFKEIQMFSALELDKISVIPVSTSIDVAKILSQLAYDNGNANQFFKNKVKIDLDGAVLTTLKSLPGVGGKKARQLLEKYPSFQEIAESSIEDLKSVVGSQAALSYAVVDREISPVAGHAKRSGPLCRDLEAVVKAVKFYNHIYLTTGLSDATQSLPYYPSVTMLNEEFTSLWKFFFIFNNVLVNSHLDNSAINRSGKRKCWQDEQCIFLSERAKVCRNAEARCQGWANKIQNLRNISDEFLRPSPWNASCSEEEKFCSLTSQCIRKSLQCNLHTLYQGVRNTTTPWGDSCPSGQDYCPVLASCIPMGKNCSLEQLHNYLQQPDSYAYYNASCLRNETYCPGSRTCISNATTCNYATALNLLASGIPCNGNSTFCVHQRKCINGPCSPMNVTQFHVSNNNTGMKLYCDNFQYICPMVIKSAQKCKAMLGVQAECQPMCSPIPTGNCKCANSSEYKCSMKAKCISVTIPCADAASYVCPSSPHVPSPSPVAVMNATTSPYHNRTMMNATTSPFHNGTLMNATTLPYHNRTLMNATGLPYHNATHPHISPSPTTNKTVMMSPTSSPSCYHRCAPGRNYCSMLNKCILIGYRHCNYGPYCAKGFMYTNGTCTKSNFHYNHSVTTIRPSHRPPNATVIRPSHRPPNATVMRPSHRTPSASVIRPSHRPPNATVMRPSHRPPSASVMRPSHRPPSGSFIRPSASRKAFITSAIRPSATPTSPRPQKKYALLQLGGDVRPLNDTLPQLDSSFKIAISALPGTSMNSEWQAYYDGSWHTIDATTISQGSALVLSLSDKIKYRAKPANNTFHGPLMINISSVALSAASGSKVNASSSLKSAQLMLLFFPDKLTPPFEIRNATWNIKEDDRNCRGKIQVRNLVRSPMPNLDKLNEVSYDSSNLHVIRFKRAVNSYRAVPEILPTSFSRGQLYVVRSLIKSTIGSTTFIPNPTDFLCFTPDKDFYGKLKLRLRNCYSGPLFAKKCHNQIQDIEINVSNVDDPFTCQPGRFSLPIIGSGVTIGNITGNTNVVPDIDGGRTGLAIVYAVNSSHGAFQYQFSGESSWQPLLVNSNPRPYGKQAVNSLDLIFLSRNDKVRFTAKDNTTGWSPRDALIHTTLHAFAWNEDDGRPHGRNSSVSLTAYTTTLCKRFPRSICCNIIQVTSHRKQAPSGCDNRPGSTRVFDACGVCGGKNFTCMGCDGVVNSGALIDTCGRCTNGTTGLAYNYLVDCAGQCNRSVVASCGSCQLKNEPLIDFRDCAGACNGKATTNKCGRCVGGNTTKPLTDGMDACGVCGGDNSTCKDCNGTVNGEKRRDICGFCLLPTDPNSNKNCIKLGTASLLIVPNSIASKFNIPAAGINQFSTFTCEFVNAANTRVSSLENTFIVQNSVKKALSIKSPTNIIAGRYKIVCIFDSTVTKTAQRNITVYNKQSTVVTTATPSESIYNQAVNITLTGQNFIDSPDILCITKRNLRFPATFISSTQVQCEIPAMPKSMRLKLSVSFSRIDRTFNESNSALFEMYAFVANIRYCKFTNNLQGIFIALSSASKSVARSLACATYLNDTSGLGTKARCYSKGKTTFLIRLGRSANISPSTTLFFKASSIKDFYGEVTKYSSQTLSCSVGGPDVVVKPAIRFNAPSTIGVCSKTTLFAVQPSGTGGRPLKISWSVIVHPSYTTALTALQTAAIQSINSTLATTFTNVWRVVLAANSSLIGVKLRYSVKVQNFLGQSSTFTRSVERINSNAPSLFVGAKNRRIKVSQKLVMKVKTIFEAKCLQGSGTSVSVAWTVDAVDVTLARSDKKKILVPRNSLKPGMTYVFTVSVAMSSDPTSSVSESITVTTISSALVAVIKIPSTIGFTESLVLNGDQSLDPDSSSETAKFRWEILTSTGKPVYHRGSLLIFNEQKPTIKLDSKLKSIGSYLVELTYSKGSRKSTARSSLVVISNIPPQIFTPSSLEKLDPTKRTLIRAEVCGIGSLTYTWSCQGCDGVSLSDMVLNRISGSRNMKRKRCFRPDLGIKANQFLGGATYTLSLTCSTPTTSVTSNVTVSMNAAPSEGALTVTPTTGNATVTEFTFDASQGFADDESDFPLTYTFCYARKSGKENCLPTVEDNFHSGQILPPGDPANGYLLNVIVYVADIYGASSRADFNVTVNPPPAKSDSDFAAEVANFQAEIAQDPLAVCAKISVNLDAMDATSGITSESLSDAQAESRQNLANMIMGQVSSGSVPTKEGKKTLRLTIIAVFKSSGSRMDKATKLSMTTNMLILIGVTVTSPSKRRRRAVTSPVIDPITAAAAEQNLVPYESLDATLFDSTSQTSKQNFLTYLDALMAGMCGNMFIGQSAAIARSKIVVIQAEYKDFSSMNNTFLSLGACSDCTSYITNASYVALGNSLLDTYSSYTCDVSKGTSCSGACITSAQMPDDFLSTSLNSSRISNVLRLKLLNPETSDHAELAATDLANPIVVKIPVTRTTNGSYQCHVWDSTSSTWVQNGIYTTSQDLMVSGNTSYVSCTVNKTAYIAVFEGPTIVATTVPPTTSPAPSTSPSNASTVPPTTASIDYTNMPYIKATFAFPLNCSDYIHNATEKAKFIASVKDACVRKLVVSNSALQNFDATCGSIIVSFRLYGLNSNSTVESVNASIQVLKNLVEAGNFVITLADGRNITADSSSFTITIPSVAPSTIMTSLSTKYAPKPAGKKGLSTGAIVGIILGCLIFIVIVVALIYVFAVRKNTKQHSTVEPNGLELQHDGIGGSQIQATLHRNKVSHWWCDKKYGWYTLWLNIEELIAPPLVECWTDDVKLVYNATLDQMQNTHGVYTRIPGFGNTSSIEYLDPALSHPGQYFAPFIRSLVDKFGYKRGFNIRAAPYDFRYGPEYASVYFTKLKALIETSYKTNGNKRVLLVSQSMGCPFSLIFLYNQSQAWKDKYLASWITISGVWGGAVKALRAYISGDPFGVPPLLDSPILMRPAQRTYTSLSFILPSKDFWNSNEILVKTEYKNYTVNDYDELFEDMGFSLASKIRKKTLPSWTPAVPGVPLFCLHGSDRRTAGALLYGQGDFPDFQPYVKYDDGDGTVNIRSLLGCLKWRGKSKHPITHKVYPGAEHNGILGDGRMQSDVFDIINTLMNDEAIGSNETF